MIKLAYMIFYENQKLTGLIGRFVVVVVVVVVVGILNNVLIKDYHFQSTSSSKHGQLGSLSL